MAEKTVVTPEDAPITDSPYSPAVIYSDLVFISGQVPVNPQTGNLVSGDFSRQAEQAFANLKTVLEMAGSSLEKVLKTTAFVKNMDDFPELNNIYKKWFPRQRPARSCVQVSGIPFNARVEIEAIAVR